MRYQGSRHGSGMERLGQNFRLMCNKRYARQLILPEIGPDGQKRLAEASVLIVGLGGLGTPAATYLTGIDTVACAPVVLAQIQQMAGHHCNIGAPVLEAYEGENPRVAGTEYIEMALKVCRPYFSNLTIEVPRPPPFGHLYRLWFRPSRISLTRRKTWRITCRGTMSVGCLPRRGGSQRQVPLHMPCVRPHRIHKT